MADKQKKEKKATQEITRDHTINLHKKIHKITFKEKAPRAIREIKKFAKSQMGTEDVRIDTNLNKFIWSNGVRNIPKRVRVRIARRKNEDDKAQG